MANNKKSFVLYCDLINTVEKLPDDEAGKLFKHLLNYVNDNSPESDSLLVDIAFEPIKQQLKRDLQKYEKRCKANKANGSKGGRPKINKPKETEETQSVILETQHKPKKPDTDTDTDTDTDIKEKKRKKKTATPKILINPDWQPSERCLELIQEAGVDVSFSTSLIKEFIFYWDELGEKRPGWDTTFLNHAKRNWERKQNEKSKQHNQSSKNQKLERANQELFERSERLESEAIEIGSGISETLGFTPDALSTAEL